MLVRKDRSRKNKKTAVTYSPVFENAPKKHEVRLIRSGERIGAVFKILYPDIHSSAKLFASSEAGVELIIKDFYAKLMGAYLGGIKKLAEDPLREPGTIKLEVDISPCLSENGERLLIRRTEVMSVGRERRVSEKTDLFDLRTGRLKG